MLKEETLSHHSANVAYICSQLVEVPDAALLQAALVHDMAEVHTGDVPFPMKAAHPPVKQYLDGVEQRCLQEWGLYVLLNEDQHQVLKVADMMDLVGKAFDELSLGNRNVLGMLRRGVGELRTMADALPKSLAYTAEIVKPLVTEMEEWLQTQDK